MFKKRKEEKRRLEEERIQREREAKELQKIQIKSKIKKTLATMKRQASKLDVFKEDYIEKARKYLAAGDNNSYNLSKAGLKICISKQRFLESMISNFEISLQVNEMNEVIGDFLKGMNDIAADMKTVAPLIDMQKAQLNYEEALSKNVSQYEALSMLLDSTANGIEDFGSMNSNNVTDDEIEQLITNKVMDSESQIDDEIEKKILEIKRKMTV